MYMTRREALVIAIAAVLIAAAVVIANLFLPT